MGRDQAGSGHGNDDTSTNAEIMLMLARFIWNRLMGYFSVQHNVGFGQTDA